MANENQIQPCCYNTANPITAKITVSDSNLNSALTQVVTYDSSTDGFGNWVRLKATVPVTEVANFDVSIQIDTGLNCCCNYNIFVDDIQVICSSSTESLLVNDIKCPGYDLTKVIDNKKSWVYNPGLPEVGISEYDIIERADGSFGLIAGEGTINRTFAPSPDAEIPWRYTNYWEQESVYEKHSNLVLNSKELWLTFDMCADCPISGTTLVCPAGFTLSANTNYCSDGITLTAATTEITVTYLSLLNLENYKKQVQSFWLPFMEQFMPATTIWVAGERWCNDPCPVINECEYDYDLTGDQESVDKVTETNTAVDLSRPKISVTIPIPLQSRIAINTQIEVGNNSLPTQQTNGIIPTNDLGLTMSMELLPQEADGNIDIQAYRNNFTQVVNQLVTV